MKRKCGDASNRPESTKTILLTIAVSLCLFLAALDAIRSHRQTLRCFDIGETALIVYGLENNRLQQTTNQLAIDRLDAMPQDAITRPSRVVYKPLDVALYNKQGLMGTMLFMQAETLDWVVQMNDANRRDCGVYRVDVQDMTDFIAIAGD